MRFTNSFKAILVTAALLFSVNSFAESCFLFWCSYDENDFATAKANYCEPSIVQDLAGDASNYEKTMNVCDIMVRELVDAGAIDVQNKNQKALVPLADVGVMLPYGDYVLKLIMGVKYGMEDRGYEVVEPGYSHLASRGGYDDAVDPKLPSYRNVYASKLLVDMSKLIRKK